MRRNPVSAAFPERAAKDATERLRALRRSRASAWSLLLTLAIMAAFPNNAAPPYLINMGVATSALMLLYAAQLPGPANRPRGLLLIFGISLAFLASTFLLGTGDNLLSLARFTALTVLAAMVACNVEPVHRVTLYRGVVAIAILQCTLTLSQKFRNGEPFLWGWLRKPFAAGGGENFVWDSPPGRFAGSMGHGIPVATLAACAILLILFGGIMRFRALITVPLVVIPAAAIAAAGSRSAIIVLALTASLMVFTQRTRFSGVTSRTLAAVGVGWTMYEVNFSELAIIQSLRGTASLEHRQGAVGTLQILLDQGAFQILAGNGWSSLPRLYENGILPRSLVEAIDNNFVTVFAYGGIAALICTVLMLARGFRRGDAGARAVILLTVGMFMSFDVVSWLFTMLLLVVVCYCCESVRTGDADSV